MITNQKNNIYTKMENTSNRGEERDQNQTKELYTLIKKFNRMRHKDRKHKSNINLKQAAQTSKEKKITKKNNKNKRQ